MLRVIIRSKNGHHAVLRRSYFRLQSRSFWPAITASTPFIPPATNEDENCCMNTNSGKRSTKVHNHHDLEALSSSNSIRSSSIPSSTSSSLSQKQRILELASFFATTPIMPDTTASASAAVTATTMHPVWQHFLETCITWGVPLGFTGFSVVASMMVMRSAQSSPKKGGQSSSSAADDEKALLGDDKNPVTELYDDLYGPDEKHKKKKRPIEEVMEVFKELTTNPRNKDTSSKKIIQRNQGIPPQQYITMRHWNQKLDSYQYSITVATQSKAHAAAKYREKNFDRALSTALTSPSHHHYHRSADLRNINKDTSANPSSSSSSSSFDPSTKRQLLELEKEFLSKGSKLVLSIQSIQTTLTRETIDEEMKRMGVYPYELDPATNDEKTEEEKEQEDGSVLFDSSKKNDNADEKDSDYRNNINNDTTITTTKPSKSIMEMVTPTFLSGKTEKSKRKSDNEKDNNKLLLEKLNEAQKELMKLELNFIKDIVSIMGTERATGIRVALLGDISVRGSGGLLTQVQERPLSVILDAIHNSNSNKHDDTGGGRCGDNDDNDDMDIDSMNGNNDSEGKSSSNNNDKPVLNGSTTSSTSSNDTRSSGHSLFVTRFSGDMSASQVTKLREEITAIVRNCRSGDEALVVLESGGGTVTGYGLAAGQLLRLKENGMKLTVVVEQVAASGGYMMCCIGDKIVGSPFAAFGSIGVLTEIPNIYNRLQREGVEFQTVTAGRYKRTITPFKEVTTEDYDKTKENLEDILAMFRNFISENRPQLAVGKKMEDLATGEVWFGTDALERGLCDAISTVDDVLLDYVNRGWDVFEVEYKEPQKTTARRLLFSQNAYDDDDYCYNGENQGIIDRTVRWFVRMLVSELVKSVSVDSLEYNLRQQQHQLQRRKTEHQQERYTAYYDGANRIRTQSSKL